MSYRVLHCALDDELIDHFQKTLGSLQMSLDRLMNLQQSTLLALQQERREKEALRRELTLTNEHVQWYINRAEKQETKECTAKEFCTAKGLSSQRAEATMKWYKGWVSGKTADGTECKEMTADDPSMKVKSKGLRVGRDGFTINMNRAPTSAVHKKVDFCTANQMERENGIRKETIKQCGHLLLSATEDEMEEID